MSADDNPPIDKEPVAYNANGNGKIAIVLPNYEKKEIELVVKNDKAVSQVNKLQVGPKKKNIYRSTEDYHGKKI